MKSLVLKITLVVIGIFIFATAIPIFGEDYLVIKKKGGPTQKVPLKFSPDQIESFQVESGEPSPREKARPSAPAAEEEVDEAAEDEGKPLEISPGKPSTGPMILKKGPETAPPTPPRPGPRQPISEAVPSQERGPVSRERVAPAPSRPAPGLIAAEIPGGKGTFSVNVYKLPENIQALPDYTAFRPKQAVTADRINLDAATGDNEPANLPENTEGLGMRFMGMFLVSGEGIFKWRLDSKDGARMHIDDKTLIENDGVHAPSSKTAFTHLAEGVHTIIVDSFNSKGPPVLKLFVTQPLGKEQVFSIGSGLAGWQEPAKPYDVLWGQVYFVPKGNYPEGPDFSKLSPVGRLIASELNIRGGEGFPGLPDRKDMVGLHYQGFFNVEGAGIFAFRLLADHYAKLTIGKSTVAEVTGGTKADPQGKLGWAFLQQGSFPITVDYFHPSGEPLLELYVTQPEKEEQFFSPSTPIAGVTAETGKMALIPAFVYFMKPGTKKIPNYNKLSPSGMFFTKAVDYPLDRGSKEFPGVPKREDWLGLRFYVKFSLNQQEAGAYKFRVVCKDAARLIIGKKIVVNAEGPAKVQDQSGTIDLQAGSHELFLDYLQTTGQNGVQLYITPPGGQEKIFAFQ
ncbi:MAG: hypothetical protein HY913_15620 [Desulfomonile tiedjei]|nr:hypothetical protein [Desulfomonile tiedjei]